jgi:hypothetical protein
MRKQIFATATMRRSIKTANDQAAHEANCRAYAEAGRTTNGNEAQEDPRLTAYLARQGGKPEAKVDHAIIVKLALRIANATEQARLSRATASRLDYPSAQGAAFEQWASSLDSDVCQLCIEMQRACRGEVGPFPSDSWSHLNGE